MPTENNAAAQAGDEPTWMTSDLSYVLAHLKKNTIFDTARIQREWDEMKALAIQFRVSPRATADVERDAIRLMFVMQDIDGFVNVEWDKYDYASHFAEHNGHEEPTTEDELIGVRSLIDAAMIATTKPGA